MRLDCWWYKKDRRNAQKVPQSLVEKISVTGGVNDIIGMIDEFYKSGASHIIFLNLSSNLEECIKIMSDKVLSYYRR